MEKESRTASEFTRESGLDPLAPPSLEGEWPMTYTSQREPAKEPSFSPPSS